MDDELEWLLLEGLCLVSGTGAAILGFLDGEFMTTTVSLALVVMAALHYQARQNIKELVSESARH